jgi:hypothetical protein
MEPWQAELLHVVQSIGVEGTLTKENPGTSYATLQDARMKGMTQLQW